MGGACVLLLYILCLFICIVKVLFIHVSALAAARDEHGRAKDEVASLSERRGDGGAGHTEGAGEDEDGVDNSVEKVAGRRDFEWRRGVLRPAMLQSPPTPRGQEGARGIAPRGRSSHGPMQPHRQEDDPHTSG